MVSNFLGDVVHIERTSAIISTSELMTREGVNLQKGMNFRDDDMGLSVFLVLPREDVFKDEWHEDTGIYIYEGHDSTTVENGKSVDQLLMYESGRLSDNGKFYKAANNFKDGVRATPLQVRVYEKLDPGVWFDKGVFNLVDATHVNEDGRKVFKFHLAPMIDTTGTSYEAERMLSATVKVSAWKQCGGQCDECGSEKGLRFVLAPHSRDTNSHKPDADIRLLCPLHRKETQRTGLLG